MYHNFDGDLLPRSKILETPIPIHTTLNTV